MADSANWATILKQYKAMKELANLINSLFGTSFTLFLVNVILDFAISFDEIFVEGTNPDWSKFIGVVFYFFNTCIILGLSAGACHQVVIKYFGLKRLKLMT